MEKIHSHINDIETPSIVKGLLQGFVYSFENQRSEIWVREVKNKDAEYHRKVLLKQGRCDFDIPTNGLSSEELICLYNYYYFAMHFQSSYWLFNHIWNSGFAVMFIINKNPIFIDLGCGTLASSIAFAQTISQQVNINMFKENPMLFNTEIRINQAFRLPDTRYNFSEQELIAIDNREHHSVFSSFYHLSQQGATYLFADISIKILDFIYAFISEQKFITGERNLFTTSGIMTKNIWKTVLIEDGHWTNNFLFDTFHIFNGLNHKEYKPLYYDEIKDYIEYYKSGWKNEPNKKPKELSTIVKNNLNNPIIINCSYLFASNSINIDEVAEFVNNIVESHNENICLIYQNPDTEALNRNWQQFKLKVSLKSIAKGVAPIKFYGSSKVRFEVLFKSKFGKLAVKSETQSETEVSNNNNDDLPF
jgi:hypothetical protein